LIYFAKETEMMFRNATRVITILAVTTALAQGTPPSTVPAGNPPATVPGGPEVMQRHGFAGRKGPFGKQTGGVPAPTSLHQRVQDMESTLSQMHLVLKQMQAKAAKSKAQDSLTKTNLDMWELMVGHLDKQLKELKLAEAAHDDMEARRAALYKQADAKAEAEAQAARAAQAGKFAAGAPTPAPARQGAGQNPAGQTAPEQPSPVPPANNSPSPN
jgi:hypothetical protein